MLCETLSTRQWRSEIPQRWDTKCALWLPVYILGGPGPCSRKRNPAITLGSGKKEPRVERPRHLELMGQGARDMNAAQSNNSKDLQRMPLEDSAEHWLTLSVSKLPEPGKPFERKQAQHSLWLRNSVCSHHPDWKTSRCMGHCAG